MYIHNYKIPIKMSFRKVLFTPKDIITSFKGAFEAWDKLSPDEKKKEPRWYKNIFNVKWEPRDGPNGVRYVNVTVSIDNKSGPPAVRFIGEINGTSIMPRDEKELLELKKKNPNSKIEMKVRTMNAGIQVKKYKSKVEKADDGISIKLDKEGKPILPPDSDKSDLYESFFWYYKAFVDEVKYQKSISKIVTDENKDGAPPGHILVSNPSVSQALQVTVKKGIKAGKVRGNPYIIISFKFNANDPSKGTQILDKRKQITINGKKDFEKAKLENGESINDNNIHKWMTFGCMVDGIVDISSISISNMGISIPAKLDICVSQPAEFKQLGSSSIYEDDNDDEVESAPTDDSKPKPEEGKSDAPTSKPASGGVVSKDDKFYQNMMN
jgi:hypothetical protein